MHFYLYFERWENWDTRKRNDSPSAWELEFTYVSNIEAALLSHQVDSKSPLFGRWDNFTSWARLGFSFALAMGEQIRKMISCINEISMGKLKTKSQTKIPPKIRKACEMHEGTQNSEAGILANWRIHVSVQLLPWRNESSLLPDINFFKRMQKFSFLCAING